MIFAVYQIQLTSEQRDAVNSNKNVPEFEAMSAMMTDFAGHRIGGLASDAFEAGYYSHVANITAEDYNDCFEVGNIGPNSQIERLGRMSSLSVGNVLVGEDGTCAVVASMGFVGFSFNPALAAA